MHPTFVQPQNLLVLGANGRTGRLVIARALAAGHRVTAVVRAPDRLTDIQHGKLSVEVGSACDERFLERIAPGHDAVISTLGPRWPTGSAAAIYPDSADALVPAMWAGGVKRLLVTSSALLFPDDGLMTRFLKWMVPAIVRGTEEMERQITSSNLNWTVARTGFLNNAETTACNIGENSFPADAGPVSRAAVAEFLVSEMERPRFSCQVVGLSG